MVIPVKPRGPNRPRPQKSFRPRPAKLVRLPPPRPYRLPPAPQSPAFPRTSFNKSAPAAIANPAAPATVVPAAKSPYTDPTVSALVNNLGGEHRLCTAGEALAFFCEGLPPGSLSFKVMAAAVENDEVALSALLARGDVLPDFSNSRGLTPLMAAAARGRAGAVEMLSAHPLVNLERQNPDGWTALHFAAWSGDTACVRSLLGHRAAFETPTLGGQTAFGLAAEKARGVFWEHRDFARRMKRAQEPPASSGKNTPVAEMKAEPVAQAMAQPGEKSSAQDALFRALGEVGRQEKLDPALDIPAAVTDKISRMTAGDFAETFRTVEAAKRDFDWRRVFVAAAAADNVPVLWFLQDKFLYDEGTLSRALFTAATAGDRREAAHHLVIWGADPAAVFDVDGRKMTAYDAAFSLNRPGCFEEMVLWSNSPGGRKAFDHYKLLGTLTGRTELTDSLHLREKKREVKGTRAKNLKSAFNRAVEQGDIFRTMAGFAEARKDRLLRGTVDFDKQAGAGAIAVALRRERYAFARRLIAEGFHLKDASASQMTELRLLGSARAKQFAEEHLSGKMKVVPVEDAGRAQRAKLRAYAAGFHGGGRFGMYG